LGEGLFSDIGISFWIARLLREGAGGEVKLPDDSAQQCLHTALLRGRHRDGNSEVGKTEQSLADILQAFLAVDEGR